jgi:hypothetical protein
MNRRAGARPLRRHHDDGRLGCSEHGQDQVQENTRVGIEAALRGPRISALSTAENSSHAAKMRLKVYDPPNAEITSTARSPRVRRLRNSRLVLRGRPTRRSAPSMASRSQGLRCSHSSRKSRSPSVSGSVLTESFGAKKSEADQQRVRHGCNRSMQLIRPVGDQKPGRSSPAPLQNRRHAHQ